MYKKQMDAPPPGVECWRIKSHGGVGDILWLFKKLSNLPKPIFLHISEENRSRPRRSGILADHLPNVAGWMFDGKTFADGGQDWTDEYHPCCAIGKTWEELAFETNTEEPYHLECNKWMEDGRRIEEWLPDVLTTHHYEFAPPGEPEIEFVKPYVVFHVAGWPDIPDTVWKTAIRMFRGIAYVYVVGGSYDRRPRVIAKHLSLSDGSLLEDLPWASLYALVKGARYVFGHASGFTALADVLNAQGVIINPRSIPRLTNTWNDLDNKGLIYVPRQTEFEAAIYSAYRHMSNSEQYTWPPRSLRGPILTTTNPTDPRSVVKDVASLVVPRNVVVRVTGEEHPNWIGSAVLDGMYSIGKNVTEMYVIGCRPEVVAAAYLEAARTTRPPVVTPVRREDASNLKISDIDLAVVYTGVSAAASFRDAHESWSRLSSRGTILIGGPHAGAVCEAIASSLRIKCGEVENAAGWYFLHRRGW